MTETEAIKTLYDGLTPFETRDSNEIWVMNNTSGLRYLTVAVASNGGDAGGPRMCSSEPVALLPGLNKVGAGWWARVEADAQRQRDRTGAGILSQMIDSGDVKKVNLDKTSADRVNGWLAATSNLDVLGELRAHPKHGENAAIYFAAFNSREANNATKIKRHFWAMYSDSRKVA